MGKSITEFSSVTRVGLDLAKHVFQVHGVDVAGKVVFNKSVKRDKLLAFFSLLRWGYGDRALLECTGVHPIAETRQFNDSVSCWIAVVWTKLGFELGRAALPVVQFVAVSAAPMLYARATRLQGRK